MEIRNIKLEQIEFNLNVLKLMHNKNSLQLSDKAKEKFSQYNQPLSEAQIELVLEKALFVCKGQFIEPEDIELPEKENELELPIGLKLETVERQYILQTLYFVQQNRTKAAEILGISIRTLRNKLNQYRMEGFL
jgi:two-component system, NtrC family, response regulator AtoC